MMRFRVLGTLEVLRGDGPVRLPSRRQRALVTRLLLEPGRVVPAAALVDAVWDTTPPRDGRHALHTQVSRARTLLGPVLVTRPPGYLLDVAAGSVDAERFEAGLARATGLAAEDPAAAVALLDELLGLWRGRAYAEFADGFAQPAAVRLEEVRLSARERRAEALISCGRLDRAISELGELVIEHPVREQPHGLLMRALYLAGRQSDALGLYHRFRDRLRDELGLDPSPVLRRAHEQVLRQAVPPSASPGTGRSPAAQVDDGDRTARPYPAARQHAAPPPPATSFVGRADELRTLTGLIGGNRIVTLVGPGGVGKTRLARELVAGEHGRTVWWVDLAPVRDPADMPYRLVDALGLPQPAERGVEGFLVDELRAARGLLVADNCEQVIGTAARVLARIAAECPQVVVLATSREPLAVTGEQVLAVAPLPEPADGVGPDSPALALFADRLRAAGAPALSADDTAAAAAICRRVGGLPLAIELAAARARSLGITTLAQRPTLDLLVGGARTDPDRHRSLRAVVDWSHDLLDTGERILFRRLAAFSGSFTLDDVEQVCADPVLPRPLIAGALAGLVDKSMVAGPAGDRYRLLDPIRGYAAEQLAGHGEDWWLGTAHARYFVGVAEQAMAGLRTADEQRWVARLTGHIDELRAVHRWAVAHDADLAVRLAAALAVYASYHMRFELQDRAGDAAALPGAAGHPLRAAALGSAACGAWARGEFAAAGRLAREAIAAAPPDDPVAAGAVQVLGDVALLGGRLSDAAIAFHRASELAGDRYPHVRCESLGGLALVASYQGDPAGALPWAEASEAVARDCGAPGLRAMARYFSGECRLASDPATALELLEEARRLATGAGALLVAGFATVSSVSLRARASGDPARACATYREAIEHWRRVGNRTQQWVTLRNLVPLLVRAGHLELACVVAGALRSAPVRLPDEVVVPEAEALGGALAEARQRLGERPAASAIDRGGRVTIDELVATVLATIGSGPVEPVEPPQVVLDR